MFTSVSIKQPEQGTCKCSWYVLTIKNNETGPQINVESVPLSMF